MNILIFLLCLLFATPSYAGMVIGSGAAGSSSDCVSSVTCAGTNQCDLICEDFEGATLCATGKTENCWGTWTLTNEPANGTITFNNARSAGLGCTGTNSVIIDKTSTEDTTLHMSKSWTASDKAYSKFYVYVSAHNLAASGEMLLSRLYSTALGGDLVRFRLFNSAGSLKFYVSYYNGAGYTSGSLSATISTGTWYKVYLEYQKSTDSNGVIKFELADTSVTNVSNNGATNTVNQVNFGNTISGTRTYTVEFDNIKLDDDAAPADCQ